MASINHTNTAKMCISLFFSLWRLLFISNSDTRRRSVEIDRKRDDTTYDRTRRGSYEKIPPKQPDKVDSRTPDYEHAIRDRRYSDSSKSKYERENTGADNSSISRDDKYRREIPPSYSARIPLTVREDDKRGYRDDDNKRYNPDRPPPPLSNDTFYSRQRNTSNGQLSETSSKPFSSSKQRLKSELSSKFPISLSRFDGGDSPSVEDDLADSPGNHAENFTRPKKHYRGPNKR